MNENKKLRNGEAVVKKTGRQNEIHSNVEPRLHKSENYSYRTEMSMLINLKYKYPSLY